MSSHSSSNSSSRAGHRFSIYPIYPSPAASPSDSRYSRDFVDPGQSASVSSSTATFAANEMSSRSTSSCHSSWWDWPPHAAKAGQSASVSSSTDVRRRRAADGRDDEEEPERVGHLSHEDIRFFIMYDHMKESFTCKQCLFLTKKLEPVKEHVRSSHTEIRDTEEVFTCIDCPLNCDFLNKYHLRLHISSHVHGQVPCEVCGEEFPYTHDAVWHMKIHHVICPVCGEQRETQKSLGIHIAESHQMEVKTERLCLCHVSR